MFNDAVKGALLAFAQAILGAAVLFGVDLTVEQVAAIIVVMSTGFVVLQLAFNGSSPVSIRPDTDERRRRSTSKE